MPVRAIITDVEGTVMPIAFVREVMFPFAAERLPDFLRANAHRPEVARELEAARELSGRPDLDIEATIALLLAWIAEDRKATPLKTLQGLVWKDGFRSGALVAPVYDDAAEKLRAWREAGLRLFVYSSGSVAAQKLVFGHTPHGDLTPLLSGHFDTTTGGKLEAGSYTRIAEEIGERPADILFLSDHTGELDAARTAGLHTICLDRGEAVIPADQAHPKVADFHAIEPGRIG